MADEAPAPAVTVVVPTFRRPDRLALTLGGLAAQQAPFRWDLIVVDNDVEASARSVVEDARTSLGVPVHYRTEARSGAAHARNRGIAEATGPVLALLDDDVVPGPRWLATLTAPIHDGRADATGGKALLDPDVPRPRWFDEPVVGRLLTHHDLGPDGPRPLEADEILVTANAAFRTDLLRRSGGFDPALGPRGSVQYVGDDVQVMRAVQALGARVWWVPDAVVVHELPPSRLQPRWILRRAYLQGRSDWRLDRAALSRRRGNGARVALSWLGAELRVRAAEGPLRPDVAFHAACDLARIAGAFAEAAAWARDRGA